MQTKTKKVRFPSKNNIVTRKKNSVYRNRFEEIPILTPEQEKILIPHIIHLVGEYYNAPGGYEVSTKRKKNDIKYKHVCMYLVLNATKKITIAKLGHYFNVKHCNIIHACNKISNYLIYDKEIQVEVNELRRSILKRAYEIANNFHNEANDINGYNYINLNDFISMKFDNKYLLGINITSHDIECIKFIFRDLTIQKHNNTGLFLIDKKEKNDG